MNQKQLQQANSEQENSYIAYGLKIKSSIPLSHLQSICTEQEQVLVHLDNFSLPPLKPTSIYRQGIQAQFNLLGETAFLHWQGVASFRAEGGRKLSVIKAKDDLDIGLLNLYLLSEALGLVLHQRGYFLLHGSSVVVDGQVLIFLGVPGAGKSTIAGAFAQKGYTVIADDLVALDISDQISVIPAFPQLKLWQNSVQGLNYDRRLTEPLFKGSQKKVVRKIKNFPYTAKLPLKAIYLLRETNCNLQIRELAAQEKIINLTRFFSCPHQLLSGKNLGFHFQQCQLIAKQVSMYELSLAKNFAILDIIVARLSSQ